MSKKNDAWGIEVGANAIKAIRLVQEAGQVRVAEYDVLPFKQVLTTPDLNVDEAIQLNLDQFLSRHDITKSTVVASVPGHTAFARFAKLPPVEPKKIPDIVKFEAVQQIPFPIDQVEWDYQVFAQPDSPDVEVGIFAITKERVAQLLQTYRSVGIKLDGLTLSPLSVYNAMSHDLDLDKEEKGVILMDIGTSSTDIIIAEGGDLWLRTLPIGGNNFTEALVRAFKLSFSKAEKLKREAGTSKYARQIFQAMRPVFADLVQEIQRSLGYYQSLNREARLEKLIGLGSTFRLPGLQKFLKQQLQMDVVRPDGFKKIAVEGSQSADFSDNAMNLATAYGLALQGLELAEIDANILPAQILRQRVWKSKQPWIGAAAAVVVLATGLAGFKYWTDNQAFRSGMAANDAKIQTLMNQARNNANQWSQVESGSDTRQRIMNLQRVLDYRDVWPKLLSDIAMAAKSVNPQEALLGSNYEKIKAIPRSQRKRLYIEAIEVKYAGEPASTGGATAGYGDMGQGYGGPGGPGGPGVAGGYGTGTTTTTGPESEQPRPIIITIRGWTPYEKGYELVVDGFLEWLKQHSTQGLKADRPYRILAETADVTKGVKPRGETAGAVGTGGETGGPFGGTPDNRGFGGGGFGGFGTPQQPTPDMNNDASDGKIDMARLLPQRPLADEPSAKDWLFEVSFKVQLLPPEQARQALFGELAPPAAPGTPGAPEGGQPPVSQSPAQSLPAVAAIESTLAATEAQR